MPRLLNEKIISNVKIAPDIFKMVIKSEYISEKSKPGQFINIKCSKGIETVLRRPISICSVDRSEGTFEIVYQIRGKGTEILSLLTEGDYLDFIGPIGNCFDIDNSENRIAVVGGGIGIFPLLYVLEESRSSVKKAFIGFRNREAVILEDEFSKNSSQLYISTDDGSYGYKGFVTDLLTESLEKKEIDIIYTCGPVPMMKKVAAAAEKYGIKCQLSMEERMGCGIGACLVCVCKVRYGDDWEYSHVCSDGPVFWSDKIIL